MKKPFFAAGLSAVCIAVTGLAFSGSGKAQDITRGTTGGRQYQPAPAGNPAGLPGAPGPGAGVAQPIGGASAFGLGTGGGGGGPKPKSIHEQLQDAIGQLRKAHTEEARNKSLEVIATHVNAIFDEDMKRRQSEVDDIRERVKSLKALIDRRKASKDRIVDLQYKIQINEVEGLGFSVRRPTRNRWGYQNAMGEMAMMMGAGMASGNPYYAHVGQMTAGGSGSAGPVTLDPRMKAEKTLKAAVSKLKSVKGGDEREAAVNALKPALEAYFTADLQVREQEITGIQKRVENLDALIDRRRKARDEIISLQLEVLSNEADGLGFFSTGVRRQTGNYGSMYGSETAGGNSYPTPDRKRAR